MQYVSLRMEGGLFGTTVMSHSSPMIQAREGDDDFPTLLPSLSPLSPPFSLSLSPSSPPSLFSLSLSLLPLSILSPSLSSLSLSSLSHPGQRTNAPFPTDSPSRDRGPESRHTGAAPRLRERLRHLFHHHYYHHHHCRRCDHPRGVGLPPRPASPVRRSDPISDTECQSDPGR